MVDFKTIIVAVLQLMVIQFLFPKIDGIKTRQDWKDSLIILFIFVISNIILRTILVKFTLGLAAIIYYVTLGVAGLILNALILLGISYFFKEKMKINGFLPAFIGGLLLAIITFIF
jgi:putative membrane protein